MGGIFKLEHAYIMAYVTSRSFYNTDGELIANYPRHHSANLTTKHQASNKWLKPMIRVIKNLRGKLVDAELIDAGLAPSYYLEGLLYNVPADKFNTSYQDCFVNALTWFQEEADKTKLLCANEQYYLLRDNAHTCWPPANCDTFLESTIKLWNNW